jgi:hypothetical protein
MLDFGALLLAAALMGLPRALRALGPSRAGSRSKYVEVAPADGALAEFCRHLAEAIDAGDRKPVDEPPGRTQVVEIRALMRARSADGVERQAVVVSATDGREERPLIVDYPRGRSAAAARALLEALARHFRGARASGASRPA